MALYIKNIFSRMISHRAVNLKIEFNENIGFFIMLTHSIPFKDCVQNTEYFQEVDLLIFSLLFKTLF